MSHSLTKFIEDESICLYALTKLVRLTADEHRDIERLGYQCHQRGTNTGHDITVGKQRMGTNQDLGDLLEGGGEGRGGERRGGSDRWE